MIQIVSEYDLKNRVFSLFYKDGEIGKYASLQLKNDEKVDKEVVICLLEALTECLKIDDTI